MMPTGTDIATRPPQAPRSRAWQVIAAALTVAALAAAGATVWIWLRGPVRPAALTGAAGHTARSARVIRQAPARLVIDIDSGGLAVRSGPAGQVTEQRVLTWSRAQPVVTQSFAAGTLTITSRCPSGQSGCRADVTLTVPPGVAVLRLNRLSGPLQVRTDSGDIVGEALGSARAGAQDTAGDISLAFTGVPAGVSATSEAGDVSIDVPRRPGGYRVRAATSAGDRTVSVGQDPASAHVIAAASDAGDVAVAYSQP
jgi:hypothetical protein